MDENGRGILMGKISYRPKKNQGNKDNKNDQDMYFNKDSHVEEQPKIDEVQEEVMHEENDAVNFLDQSESLKQETVATEYEEVTEGVEEIEASGMREIPNKSRREKKKLDNVKMVGDMDCEYHIYMEDYVYTYIYQYAYADLSKENAAILIGEVYLDSKEAMITGMIPVDAAKLTDGSEWINLDVVNEIEEIRKQYFPDQDIIGWLHMQPGYGTMLTMKELREHRSVFEGAGSVFMLVDALNKVETVYVYEDDELKEQSGYCMYYEPNEPMQKYMVEHPFAKKETEEIKDTVVNQFREIGKIRKEEYLQKKNMSFTIMAAAVILVALTGVIVRMNATKNIQDNKAATVMSNAIDDNATSSDINGILVQPNDALGEEVGEADVSNTDDSSEDATQADEKETNSNVVDANGQSEQEDKEEVPTISQEEVVGDTETEDKKEEVQPVKEADEVSTAQTDTKAASDTEYDIYVVKQGDTLANISYDKYGDAKKSLEIAKINGLDSTNNIYVGQELKMPKK